MVYNAMSRSYGAWVTRNPTLVLCSSLAVVIVLCFGLIRFEVETRPEKVSYFIFMTFKTMLEIACELPSMY